MKKLSAQIKGNMKEIFNQLHNQCPVCRTSFGLFFLPFSDEDREKSKEFKLYQVVRSQVYGIKKERSMLQLRLYWAACGFCADNTENWQWNTKEKVDFQCRVAAHFVDPDLVVVKPDGSVQFSYRSIAVKNLGHIEACRFFDRGFETMTDFYNAEHGTRLTVEDVINLVKESMKGGA